MPPVHPTYPLVIFLWGYLKSRVYVNRPTNLADLKANIREEITNIPANTLARVMESTKDSLSSVSILEDVI
ncbi:Transposable element Tc3 transposase [Caligus rogercresseyi]|uniref:Transposable element Tc3 transposase n=1 Tax=Caligus rogercresseyi TaxID=217165 RepID=A0A7T8KGT2_CALRO|nr:Transposable element Tc3 transposase [Caligus rogercresseyi]